ncbi:MULTISPECIES: type II toxin-antitoxin system RelE/ParE family toxin [unclassified Kaistella]|uniref:type II toxin-antitoxin system RelE/ParE family toxin n=1 Tax=unclassified Kaistella TaxID=2762626 RepID=UPI002732E9AD|nr:MULTISPECIES: type II toxin-antitoxin system RelE/ParE family toxin [unclassified Kaistella]MDP2454521.1 type II toxin-antitoxin system RelE/ParE family toxin [Kaistella sp. SH11-4b]MDP2457259.1 type II toxin-antitoxin system RelE/ParE family toxin [Kaistella sp. SH40-3]MDP2460019.1 type II toxin-antitoxin system RelE/ParE family toxin [Kaistella sp. SH19-2b]
MVRTIIWTEKAKKELFEILKYWNNRNKSKSFSLRLNNLVEEQLSLITEFPKIARATDIPNVNVKVVHKYLLYYEIVDDVLYVLTFRNGSKNPKTLKIR